MSKITDKENSQKPSAQEKTHTKYTIEQLRGMSIKQILNLNGLGTLKKNPPKAVQITRQEQPKEENSKQPIFKELTNL